MRLRLVPWLHPQKLLPDCSQGTTPREKKIMSKYQDALIAELLAKEPAEQLTIEDETFKRYDLETDGLAGAILVEDDEGEVSATWFEDDEELSEAWDALSGDDQADDEDEDED